jgi:hypothetical protein
MKFEWHVLQRTAFGNEIITKLHSILFAQITAAMRHTPPHSQPIQYALKKMNENNQKTSENRLKTYDIFYGSLEKAVAAEPLNLALSINSICPKAHQRVHDDRRLGDIENVNGNDRNTNYTATLRNNCR